MLGSDVCGNNMVAARVHTQTRRDHPEDRSNGSEIILSAVRIADPAGMVRRVAGTLCQIALSDLLPLSLGMPGFSSEASES